MMSRKKKNVAEIIDIQANNYGDRICDLCHLYVGKKKNGKWKVMNWHHTRYPEGTTDIHHVKNTEGIVVKLCYVCHNLIHGRNKFYNPWEKKYGPDNGPYMFALDVIELYNRSFQKNEQNKEDSKWKKDVLRQG